MSNGLADGFDRPAVVLLGAVLLALGQDPGVIDVSFRAMTEADLPLLAAWLGEAHVHRWWQNSAILDDVRAKYLPRILGDEPTEMTVMVADGRDVGVIQSFCMSDHPDWERSLAPAGLTYGTAVGLDYAIGVRDLIARGIGSQAIDTFSGALFASRPDVDQIVVTPQAANRPSCRVLEKAGYRLAWTGMLDSDRPSDSGPAALYVLDRRPSDA